MGFLIILLVALLMDVIHCINSKNLAKRKKNYYNNSKKTNKTANNNDNLQKGLNKIISQCL